MSISTRYSGRQGTTNSRRNTNHNGRRNTTGGARRSSTRRNYGKKKRMNTGAMKRWGILFLLLIGILIALVQLPKVTHGIRNRSAAVDTSTASHRTIEEWPELDVQLLDVNPYSRPGTALEKVNGVVVHYTANPGTTAQQNRDYFAGLATEHTTKASSHFVIGLEGEIIQCVPCNEISYCSNQRNSDTIAIECCVEDESGVFNRKTYDSLVELVSWLVCRYDLAVDDVIRHYDVTEKICPKDFVDHPEKWETFKTDVAKYIKKHAR